MPQIEEEEINVVDHTWDAGDGEARRIGNAIGTVGNLDWSGRTGLLNSAGLGKGEIAGQRRNQQGGEQRGAANANGRPQPASGNRKNHVVLLHTAGHASAPLGGSAPSESRMFLGRGMLNRAAPECQ